MCFRARLKTLTWRLLQFREEESHDKMGRRQLRTLIIYGEGAFGDTMSLSGFLTHNRNKCLGLMQRRLEGQYIDPLESGRNRREGWVLFSYPLQNYHLPLQNYHLPLQNYHLLLGKLRQVSTFLKSKFQHVDLSVGLASQVAQWSRIHLPIQETQEMCL